MSLKTRQRVLQKMRSTAQILPSGSVQDHFADYCASTSIHGVKYLGEKDRPVGERFWWLIIFLGSFAGNAYLISKVWTKWNESPVIVSFAESTTPVWQVPFPAVTICSETKSRASIFNFTEAIYANSTDPEELRKKGDISLLCDPHVTTEGNLTTDETTIDFFIEVAPPFEDTLSICKWKNELLENCSDIFTPLITEDGICYTFNLLDNAELFRGDGIQPHLQERPVSEGWTLERGYKPGTPLNTYPYRAWDAGTKAGLFIVMVAFSSDFDYYCRGPIQGFKILLHNPAEIPSVGERYFRAPINQEVLVAVNPDIITTNEGLRSYSPERRQCYFPSERYLSHFKVYTQRNCELECLTNYTLETCGCVGFYMPRDGNTSICGAGSKECMIRATDELRRKGVELSHAGVETEDKCDCLPACASLQYQAEISQADFDWRSVLKAYDENSTEFQGMNMARVSIFFNDKQFITSRRSELFGPVDFLANCGGLLGLFCGVSLLSLVELVYYMTLRFWGNVKRRRQIEKENSRRLNLLKEMENS